MVEQKIVCTLVQQHLNGRPIVIVTEPVEGRHSGRVTAVVGVGAGIEQLLNDSKAVIVAFLFLSNGVIAPECHFDEGRKASSIDAADELSVNLEARRLLDDVLAHQSVTVFGTKMERGILVAILEKQHFLPVSVLPALFKLLFEVLGIAVGGSVEEHNTQLIYLGVVSFLEQIDGGHLEIVVGDVYLISPGSRLTRSCHH